ncbi:TPA: hypothetical protein OUB22_000448 [Proteus mirabilis]|nr:hypothetical protein [Proteus mirabilis]
MKTQTINNPRTPTLIESLFPIFTMVVLLGGGYAAFDLPPEPLMVLSTVVAALLVKRLGYRYDEILTAISQKIAKTMPALLILISVGLLIGTWMVGGTIPLMIYYGLKMISPEMLYVTALLATLSYLPWAVLCWSGIFFAMLWGFTGFGIAKLTPEEQEEMTAELGSHSELQLDTK